jgi:hypothetical protein
MSEDRFPVAWTMPDETVEHPDHDEHLVIDLTRASCHPHLEAHCPACGGRHLQAMTLPGGERYDRCPDCSRVWELRAGSIRLIVDAEVVTGEQ